jgi:hypothetical protein
MLQRNIIWKNAKVNSRPMGENSPNLVTLLKGPVLK